MYFWVKSTLKNNNKHTLNYVANSLSLFSYILSSVVKIITCFFFFEKKLCNLWYNNCIKNIHNYLYYIKKKLEVET
jgi:hypothetical protein